MRRKTWRERQRGRTRKRNIERKQLDKKKKKKQEDCQPPVPYKIRHLALSVTFEKSLREGAEPSTSES